MTAARAALEQALAEERDAAGAAEAQPGPAGQGLRFRGVRGHRQGARRKARPPAWPTRARTSAPRRPTSRNAQVSVDYTVIRAPFDGVILSKSANVGDLVTPFSSATDSKGAVVSMADMSTLEVEADVAESSLSKINVGQPAEILLDALPDSRFRGRISRMVPTVDRAKATVMTKVKFDEIDPRILPEMSAKVSFLSQDVTPEQQKPLVAVAADALVAARRPHRRLRHARRQARPRCRSRPGKKIGDLTAITGEVKSGDKVVLKPAGQPRFGRAGEAREVARMPHAQRFVRRRHRLPSTRAVDRADAAAGGDPQPDQVLHARRPDHPGAGRHQPRRHGGRLHRADGAVGLGQVHAAQPDRRHRQAVVRARSASPAWTSRTCPKATSPPGAPRTSASSSSSTT